MPATLCKEVEWLEGGDQSTTHFGSERWLLGTHISTIHQAVQFKTCALD